MNAYEELRKANDNKRADCAVIALALLTDNDYSKVEALLADFGRKKNSGTKLNMIMAALAELKPDKFPLMEADPYSQPLENYLPNVYYEFLNEGYLERVGGRSRLTVNRIAKERKYKKGKYLLITCNHALAMIDGEVLDWSKGKRNVVKLIIKDKYGKPRKTEKLA